MSVIAELRDWQKRAFNKLSGKQYGLIKAITGAGKTVAIAKIAHHWYNNVAKPNAKIIVTVPSKGIGSNFENIQIESEGIKFVPNPENVLTLEQDDYGSKTDNIISFLESKTNKFQDSILICCHASYMKAVQKRPDLFVNCFVVIDEFHHSNASGEDVANELGKCMFVICHEKSNSVLMATATPFRTDGQNLFPDFIRDQVEIFSYNISEYLKDCKHLKFMKFHAHCFEHVNGYAESLTELLSKGIGNSIVFLPHIKLAQRRLEVSTVLASALGVPLRDANGQINQLDDLKNPTEGDYRRISDNEVVWEYKNQKTGRKLVIIDLDDDNTIREKRMIWLKNNKNVDPNTDHLIITLQVFVEGGDFPALSRVINLGIDNSLLRMIQKWGRAARDYFGKDTAHFVQFINTHEAYGVEDADENIEEQVGDMLDLLEADPTKIIAIHKVIVAGEFYEKLSKQNPDTDFVHVTEEKQYKLPFKSVLVKSWKPIAVAALVGLAVGTVGQLIYNSSISQAIK